MSLLFLEQIPGVGRVTIRNLFDEGHTPQDLFEALLQKLPTHEQDTVRIRCDAIAKQLNQRSDFHCVTWFDTEYPSSLKELPDAPLFFFYKGSLAYDERFAIAVVGTRAMTTYGKAATERIVGELSDLPITIVSGFMRGVDTVAHRLALTLQKKTIAVLGSGFEKIVPVENEYLIPSIIDNGAVISEFLPGQRATKYTFPMRNRIVAALSRCVVVIEAGAKSGALITARLGAEIGRSVTAVPGSIFSPQSAGTNWLIANGAYPVTSGRDIIDLMGWEGKQNSTQIAQTRTFDNELQQLVYDIIERETGQIDEIVRALGLDVGAVAGALSLLELKGYIKNIGNNTYVVD